MRFGVLGPVTAEDSNGRSILSGSGSQRVLLAVLLCHPNRPVPRSVLGDAIWGEAAHERVTDGLRVHLHHLRKALGSGRLTRQGGGYQLTVLDDELDAAQFRRLVREARDAATGGDRPGERALVRRALALWRGPAFAGIDRPASVLVAETATLLEERADAFEDAFEVELALGLHHEICHEIRSVATDYPFRERLRGQLMLALYRAHRQAEALKAYEETRRLLADELGVDPGRQLRDLYERMLGDDPTLTAPDSQRLMAVDGGASNRDADALSAMSRPAQLPLDVYGFSGREAELKWLDALLDSATAQPTAVVVSALSGTAGIGKTALAVHWAHRVADRFDGGQLYVNLRGFDPSGSPMSPAEAVRGFLDALGVPAQRIPPSIEGQVGLYRSHLSGRRVLVVLDNARGAEQVRPLLPGAPGCLVVVTSRNHLAGLAASEGAQLLTLDLLSTTEARDLLASRLGEERIAAEPQAVTEIIARCAGLPLALSVVTARAATQSARSLTAVAAELSAARDSLDPFGFEDSATDLRMVFSWSYRTLTAQAARMFRLLGLHPGPDIATPAVASLAGLPGAQTRHMLAELKRAHLVVEHQSGRFTFHDLLRSYAAELTALLDPDAERQIALRRLLDHYLHTAREAAMVLDPHRDPVTLVPAEPGVVLDTTADHEAALAWFTTERRGLLAAIDHAATTGFDTHAWQLAWAVANFLHRQGHWHEQAIIQRTALEAARRVPDRVGEVHAHYGLGRAYTRLTLYDDAIKHYQHALDLYRELGNPIGEAHTHKSLALLYEQRGSPWQALGHDEHALDLYSAAGYRPGRANTLNGVGWLNALLGRHERARAYCEQALTLLQELGDRVGEANTWDSLGYIHRNLGDHEQATACYTRAVELYREVGDRHNEADTLDSLGEAYAAGGDADAARDSWRLALAILDEFGHPDADRLRDKLYQLDSGAGEIR